MKIFEYLQEKYGEQGPFVVTGVEARFFGIPYPLKKGWYETHAAKEITVDVARKLAEKLYEKGMRSSAESRSNYCLSGAAILRRISA